MSCFGASSGSTVAGALHEFCFGDSDADFVHSNMNVAHAAMGKEKKTAQTQCINKETTIESMIGLPPNSIGNSSEKFILIETNFRVFAYTENKLYKEILRLFLEPQKEFNNMFYGILKKSKVEQAFKSQISANQIMKFLITHAHPDSMYVKKM